MRRPRSPPRAATPDLVQPTNAVDRRYDGPEQLCTGQTAGFLRLACAELSAPSAVWTELCVGVQRGWVPSCDWSWLSIVQLTEQEGVRADEIGRNLGAGESACITVAASRGLVMLSDDWQARELARSLGLEVSGSLGILDRLLSREMLVLEEADALLAHMVRRGFRSPIRSLRELRG